MFNGIIYDTGSIIKIEKRKKGINLFINSNINLTKKKIGISVSCDGACLTLISVKNKNFEFFLSSETVRRSNFKDIRIGKVVNLELPLKKGQDISGHICQGHVDTTGKIMKITKQDRAYIYDIQVSKNTINNLVDKASILINGVSLTISKIYNNRFQIWLIPHTLKLTNLSKLSKNDIVNIEIDILSKYVKKFINEKKKI